MMRSERQKDWLALAAALVIVFLLGLGAWPLLRSSEGAIEQNRLRAAQLATLPARGGEAPVLAAMVEDGDEARARNAADPFLAGPLTPAPRFRFQGSPRDQGRAVSCLALAAMAEAGPSDGGQRAVMQVVLNRVRHPAFAPTICGVVFEGADRDTGCQFSFTCDGSLARRYSEADWSAARGRAIEALTGQVYATVGNATHYHTDWVYPAWSPLLVKLARVDTHLFFRWPGYWGTAAAMRRTYRGGEPDPAGLIAPPVPATAEPLVDRPPLPPDTPAIASGEVVLRVATGRVNFIRLDPEAGSEAALASARQLCGRGGTCRVYGWRDLAPIPAALPLTKEARAVLVFSYLRDPLGAEIALFDCRQFPSMPRNRCIPRGKTL